ncbi:hypothetical protein B0H13DRAFT_2384848 [Mycena leptocephala]|nr:hypothetical protein B0H13DRAFT_2384848 [Mycena leptocephala]
MYCIFQFGQSALSLFRSWPATRESRQKARETQARKFAALRTSALLDALEPLKPDDEDSIKEAPATETDIADVEVRLGMPLPADYREFLLVSNGMKFIPSLELPGLRPVAELAWEESKDLGLDELEITLGAKFGEEKSRGVLPKMGRILMISAADDEEQVWLLEPSQVERTLEILADKRTSTRSKQAVGWRIVLWRHWCPETVWYQSFRSYLQAAARRAGI